MPKKPVVLTLDAGGTNFVFSAVKNGVSYGKSFSYPAKTNELESCIQLIIDGFEKLASTLDEKPDAISFAFPGPADYEQGIIGDLPNLPAFKGGTPLASMIEERLGIPVFINNDGNLFTLGESKSGFLPYLNQQLNEAGSSRRFNNLIGITLGTGFGVGVSINGQLVIGDNSVAAEGWLLRNKHYNYSNVEDTLSIRSIKRIYAEQISMDPAKAPEPHEIFEVAIGQRDGIREAAIETFLRYGEVLGDAIAHLITIVDGVVVIGGGVSGAYPIFSRSMLDELNGSFTALNGKRFPRLIQEVYDFENEFKRRSFLNLKGQTISIPGSETPITYYETKSTVVGLSKLGTSKAISLGAYHFAVEKLG
ncbi:MAG: ROK family protein [Balneola sp.]|nr:MAG: ROK family protein [Balneola sp.]